MQKLKLDRPMTIQELTEALDKSEANNKALKGEVKKYREKFRAKNKELTRMRNERNKLQAIINRMKFEDFKRINGGKTI